MSGHEVSVRAEQVKGTCRTEFRATCVCGRWVEKAPTRAEADERGARHVAAPHLPAQVLAPGWHVLAAL